MHGVTTKNETKESKTKKPEDPEDRETREGMVSFLVSEGFLRPGVVTDLDLYRVLQDGSLEVTAALAKTEGRFLSLHNVDVDSRVASLIRDLKLRLRS